MSLLRLGLHQSLRDFARHRKKSILVVHGIYAFDLLADLAYVVDHEG